MRTKDSAAKRRAVQQQFIETGCKLIEKDGIGEFTIRNVAKGAGYNSATTYNYFTNADELKNLCLLRAVEEYFNSMIATLRNNNEKSYIVLLQIWRNYARYSFLKPDIYQYVFYSKETSNVLGELGKYFSIYPNPNFKKDDPLSQRVLGASIAERDSIAFDPVITDGYVAASAKRRIMDFSYALELGMAIQVQVNDYQNIEQYCRKFIDYLIDFLLANSTIPESKNEILDKLF